MYRQLKSGTGPIFDIYEQDKAAAAAAAGEAAAAQWRAPAEKYTARVLNEELARRAYPPLPTPVMPRRKDFKLPRTKKPPVFRPSLASTAAAVSSPLPGHPQGDDWQLDPVTGCWCRPCR